MDYVDYAVLVIVVFFMLMGDLRRRTCGYATLIKGIGIGFCFFTLQFVKDHHPSLVGPAIGGFLILIIWLLNADLNRCKYVRIFKKKRKISKTQQY